MSFNNKNQDTEVRNFDSKIKTRIQTSGFLILKLKLRFSKLQSMLTNVCKGKTT